MQTISQLHILLDWPRQPVDFTNSGFLKRAVRDRMMWFGHKPRLLATFLLFSGSGPHARHIQRSGQLTNFKIFLDMEGAVNAKPDNNKQKKTSTALFRRRETAL